jgi:hypothetical protein
MNPDLERILNALYERDNCHPSEWHKWDATVRRLLDDILCRHPQTTHEQIKRAIADRYHSYCRAKDKYPTLPPEA